MIVYIGQGCIADRIREHMVKNWGNSISKIEYSKIDNEQDRLRWEKYWLDRFRSEHEMFPRHNAIGGIHTH